MNATDSVNLPVVPVVDPTLLASIYRLRALAWSHEGITVGNGDRWQDEHDLHAFHWAVLNQGGEPIAATRLCIHDDLSECPDRADLSGVAHLRPPIACLNRTVVSPSHRRRGLARALLGTRVEFARARGCRSSVIVVSRQQAAPLIRMGFRAVAELAMRKTVPMPGLVLVASLPGA